MKKRYFISDQKGFTLIEILLVMVILSVIASVMVIKSDSLSVTASNRALQVGIKELNGRETLVWTKLKMSSTGWTNDDDVFAEMDTNLGADYAWTTGPNASGGTLNFKSESIALSRTSSTKSLVGNWQ